MIRIFLCSWELLSRSWVFGFESATLRIGLGWFDGFCWDGVRRSRACFRRNNFGCCFSNRDGFFFHCHQIRWCGLVPVDGEHGDAADDAGGKHSFAHEDGGGNGGAGGHDAVDSDRFDEQTTD